MPEQVLDELTRKPKLFDTLAFKVQLPHRLVEGRTSVTEHGYGFHVLWSSHKSDRARVSLHSYTLESPKKRENGTYHVQEHIFYGQSVIFEVGA